MAGAEADTAAASDPGAFEQNGFEPNGFEPSDFDPSGFEPKGFGPGAVLRLSPRHPRRWGARWDGDRMVLRLRLRLKGGRWLTMSHIQCHMHAARDTHTNGLRRIAHRLRTLR